MNVPAGTYFDHESLALDIAFIESFTLTKSTRSGKPEPFRLLEPHKKLVSNVMGWKRADGTRLYRRAYFSTARKNAKSQIAAAIGLLMLVMDNEQSPEIYLAAKTTDQASVVFRAAADMVNAHAELSKILKVVPYSKTIINPLNNGVLKALSGEGKQQHGKNPSCVIIDEFHTFSESEQELYDALTTGSGARRSPLFLIITTAGLDEYSLCGREYQKACKIRDGVIDDPFYLPLIYEVPKDADWTDPSLYHLANPCVGDILTLEGLIEERDIAINTPSEQTKFRRLTLNQWVNAKSTWIPLDKWDACKWDGLPIHA